LTKDSKQRPHMKELFLNKWIKKMSLEEPMAENTLIEIGMNLYTFK